MHAYRCKECTLVRCDVDGAVCDECVASLGPANFGLLKAAISVDLSVLDKAALSYTYTLRSLGALTPSSPAAPPSSVHLLIPGDDKHNATECAKFLMEVGWGGLLTFAKSLGITFPVGYFADLHKALDAYGNSP